MSPTLLSAFRHPLLWASILTLLINDHILKTLAPSWLTGKLSDLAGLFFFPFLVGAALHIVLMPCQEALAALAQKTGTTRPGPGNPAGVGRPSRAAGTLAADTALLISFGLCAALFTALKTLPTANALAAGLLSQMYNTPIRIALDPTDLLALLVFFPAWALWRRLEQVPRPTGARPSPGRLAYAALGLGALASLATAPCPPAASIQRLAAVDSTLYAAASSGGYASPDQGRTWTYLNALPAAATQAMARPPALPLTRCDPAAPLTCYRITGLPQVEESQDGGQTWRIAWQVPPGRESYMQRVASGYALILGRCGKQVDLQTFDLVFVPGPPGATDASRPGGTAAVVAMGNEGLLLHDPGSNWRRTALLLAQAGYTYPAGAAPTPFAARSLDEALQNTQPEWLSALGLALVAYLGFSLWAWIAAARRPAPAAAHPGRWIFRPLRWLLVWAALLAAGFYLQGIGGPGQISDHLRSLLSPTLLLAAAAFPFGSLLFSVILWRRAASLAAQPVLFGRLGWQAVLAGVALFATPTLIFLLWAFGLLVTYELAQVIAVLTGLVLLVAFILRLHRRLKAALN